MEALRQTVGDFERLVILRPAWDERDKGHGLHPVDMSFAVLRERAAVELLLYTGWHLPHVEREASLELLRPLPAHIQWHAPDAWDEGARPATGECGLTGGTCYYAGLSSLSAIAVFDVLRTEGLDATWRELEQRWVSRFGGRYA